jgi:hypothetical protein
LPPVGTSVGTGHPCHSATGWERTDMASWVNRKRADGGTSVQIRWREEGQVQSETFTNLRLAGEFRSAVEAGGNVWPEGCVRRLRRARGPERSRDGAGDDPRDASSAVCWESPRLRSASLATSTSPHGPRRDGSNWPQDAEPAGAECVADSVRRRRDRRARLRGMPVSVDELIETLDDASGAGEDAKRSTTTPTTLDRGADHGCRTMWQRHGHGV